ncbi:MAG: hypothetical protein ACLUDF_05340 [Butyricicoccus sp.]
MSADAFDEVQKSHYRSGVKMGEGWLPPTNGRSYQQSVTNIVCTQRSAACRTHRGQGHDPKNRSVPQANIVAVDYDPARKSRKSNQAHA